jgi:hypothetical protein
MGLAQLVDFLPVPGTKRFNLSPAPICNRLLEIHSVKWFAANVAADKIECRNFLPGALQKILKFNRFLRTNAPALPAAGTQCQIVPQ